MQAPPPELIAEHRNDLVPFKEAVEAVMAEFPELQPISWFRDPQTNREAGGDPFSQHLIGLAVDLDYAGADLEYFERVAQRFLARGMTVVIYWNERKRALHVQALPGAIDPAPPLPLIPVGAGWRDFWRLIKARVRAPEPYVSIVT
jgi:hypothetical protein